MNLTEWRQWLENLKEGDLVAVAETGGRILFEDTVKKRTKSGRIVLSDGKQFQPNGYIYGAHAPCYRDRRLVPRRNDEQTK